MVADTERISSLHSLPDGVEWHPRGVRGAWGSLHPSYKSLVPSSAPGPREDAEPTEDLPTLTPGIDGLPTVCEQCGSRFVVRAEALGPDQRGLMTCQSCSRQLCWLRPALRWPSRTTQPTRPAAVEPRHLPASTPAPQRVIPHFAVTDGCGATCSVRYGHDPERHERYGRAAAFAEMLDRPTGVLRSGALVLDFDAETTTVDGVAVMLSAVEQRLLDALASRPGQFYPRFELVAAVWDQHMAEVESASTSRHPRNLLSATRHRLRKRLGAAASLVETIPARGMRLRIEPPV